MRDAERRASEARRLLDEPLLNEALDKIERDAIEDMLRLPWWIRPRKRRMACDRVRAIRGIRSQLRSVILTGREAAPKPPPL
jgi:hypothetical protein